MLYVAMKIAISCFNDSHLTEKVLPESTKVDMKEYRLLSCADNSDFSEFRDFCGDSLRYLTTRQMIWAGHCLCIFERPEKPSELIVRPVVYVFRTVSGRLIRIEIVFLDQTVAPVVGLDVRHAVVTSGDRELAAAVLDAMRLHPGPILGGGCESFGQCEPLGNVELHADAVPHGEVGRVPILL